jgi:hypothetical protein
VSKKNRSNPQRWEKQRATAVRHAREKNPNWRDRSETGYESYCMYCAVASVAAELEEAVKQRDGQRALDLRYELTGRVERLSKKIQAWFVDGAYPGLTEDLGPGGVWVGEYDD